MADPKDAYAIQYDAQNRPFMWKNGQVGGEKNYISPVAFGAAPPQDTTGIFHKAPQWNTKTAEWETPFDWSNALNIGVGGALTAGLGSAIMAGGAPAAAGGGSGAAAGAGSAYGPLAGGYGAASTYSVPASLSATGGGGMGLWGTIGNFALDNLDEIIGGVGSGMGAASQAQASNRGSKLAAQMALSKILMERDATYWDQLMEKEKQASSLGIAREQEGRVGRQDAWRKLQSAQRLLSPAAYPTLSPYQAPQRQATAAERQGADALTAEVMARLTGGNPIAMPNLPTPEKGQVNIDEGLMDAGLSESTMGWLSPFLIGASGQRRRDAEERARKAER